MTTVNFAVSQPSATDCILNVGISSSSSNSNCGEGNWGGFLNNNCCGGAFDEYLYALAQRANQTGQVFLDSTDQRNCLTTLKSEEADIMGCGIEKLTSGSGDCSDFSVNDVNDRLGNELRSLKENCKFVSPVGGWNQSCGACTRSWKDIKGIRSKDGESDICRFAVLVSLTSTIIENQSWVQNIYECLGKQEVGKDIGAGGGNSYKKSKAGSYLSVIISTTDLKVGGCLFVLKRAIPKESGYLKLPIKEVYSATDNLNELNFIGEGTAGKVFKGILPNGQQVAVKHIINDGCIETFLREVRSLSHVRHPNLVPLLGYSENGDECFLIYELCPNGNLSEWIFGTVLKLNMPSSSLIHPTNILLGQNFEAKLSDFGLSKVIDLGVTYVSSEVRGTFGYVDPEYQNNRHVNSAGDVYGFGIVLLQILSGRKVSNLMGISVVCQAKSLNRNDNIVGFADPQLDGEYSAEAFDLMFKLALSCTGLQLHRPSMERVVSKLEEAMDISTRAKASTPFTTPDWSSTPHATPDWSSTP
ncbi:hypothetical protein RJ639_032422 [Escallonia herrerae]|uniref:Protein kinase domain-containing protein n=1 Tax=Escallonia herrerae TaxID=1293975 RepID=A0AA88WVE8_9ASTE|nr:hypothetical protein RJ639_032422 [Escallonia herrerae]